MKKILTLCVVHEPERVLLGMKKKGFGAGNWNGFGGKLQEGESIIDAARREVTEEAGIVVEDLDKRGVITFVFPNNPEELEVHIFSSTSFTGEPTESEEMKPQWYALADIPYDTMWPDDRHWLPLLLAGKKFTGTCWFTEQGGIERFDLQEG